MIVRVKIALRQPSAGTSAARLLTNPYTCSIMTPTTAPTRAVCGGYMAESRHIVLPKVCPRCHGYMHTNRDMYGEYRECLRCGYMVDVAEPDKPSVPRIARTGRTEVA